MPTSYDLRQQRAAIWEQAKALLEQAESEGRALSPVEQENWDKAMADMDALKERIDRQERAAHIEAEMGQREPRQSDHREGDADGEAERREYARAFDSYLRYGRDALLPEQRQLLRQGYQQFGGENRALTTLTGSAGGYAVPDADMAPLTAAMIDWGGMRQAARVWTTTNGQDIPVPTVNDTGNIGRRITENTQVASNQDPSFSGKVLRAYIYTSDVVLVPFALLEDANFDVGAYLLGEFGVRLGRIENSEDTNGTGDSQPEGLITVATSGVTAAAAEAVTYDELIDLEHSVYAVYRRNGRFMFKDSTLKYLKKLQDGDGRPLWAPGIAQRVPDTLLGYPYVINADMPAMTTGLKSIAFGDFSYHWLRDVRGITILRLEERYADYGQVGFLAFHRHDAKYINAGTNPIKVLTQG